MRLYLAVSFYIFWMFSALAQSVLGGYNSPDQPQRPPAQSIGSESNWYIDFLSGNVFGPKTSGQWPQTPTTTIGGGSTPYIAQGATASIAPSIRSSWRITPMDFAPPPVNPLSVCQGFSGDDTAAVQAAINYAQTYNGPGGRVVYIDGQCMTTSELDIASTVSVVCENNANGIALNTATSGTPIIKVGFQTVRLSNAKIKGCILLREQTDSTSWAIDTLNTGNFLLDGVYIYGNNGSGVGNGVRAANYFNFHIHNTFTQNVINSGIDLEGSTSNVAGAVGAINSIGTITPGTGGTNDTYFNVLLSGGHGTGAIANILVASNGVSTITFLTPDAGGYQVGDVLSASSAAIGGTTGFSVPVTSVGIGSADFKIDGGSRVDGGINGITEGDWVGGVYVEDTIFDAPTAFGFKQTSTQPSHILDSYHFVGDDFDSVPTALSFFYANEAHITGNRFGFNFSNPISINKGRDDTITGNNIVGGAGNCILLSSSGDGTNFVSGATITGNTIDGCSFGVDANTGSSDITISGNTFKNQTSAAIASGCVTRLTIGPNTIDSSLDGGPYSIACPSADIQWVGTGGNKRLGELRGANMNVTTDQLIPISSQITAFQISSITVTNCSESMTTVQGGFYPAASKGGTAIVASSQAYSAATGPTIIVNPTISATPLATRYAQSQIYFSLTTPQGTTGTCDIYIDGKDLT